MRTKSFAIFSALTLALSTISYGMGEPVEGKCLTDAEAAKIQPPPKGGYPTADPASGDGSSIRSSIVASPYNTGHKIDCSKCPRGGLVLDPLAKKVFRKP